MFVHPTIPGTTPHYSLLVTSTDAGDQSESSVRIPPSTQGTLTLTKHQLQPTEKQPRTTTQVDLLTKKWTNYMQLPTQVLRG